MPKERILYLGTSSRRKYQQYAEIFGDLGVGLRRGVAVASAMIEPQSDDSFHGDVTHLVAHPLRLVARFAQRYGHVPYVIEDTMLLVDDLCSSAESLLGLPGADTKSWWRNLGSEGLLRLMATTENRSARFCAQLGVYLGPGQYLFSYGELRGRISHVARVSEGALADVPFSSPFYFHQVFIPDGQERTLAELSGPEFATVDYRRRSAEDLVRQLERCDWQSTSQMALPFLDRE